jgi:hypothetical protein
MAEVREALRQRQERWMQQRQAELDRQGAQTAVGVKEGGFDSRVLDKLTEQITARLQVCSLASLGWCQLAVADRMWERHRC